MPNALNTNPQTVNDTNEDGKLVLPTILGVRGGEVGGGFQAQNPVFHVEMVWPIIL